MAGYRPARTMNRSRAESLRDLRVVDLADELPIAQVLHDVPNLLAQVLARLAGMFAMTAIRREASEVGYFGLRAHGDLRSPEVQRAGAAFVAALLVGCSSQASGMAADPHCTTLPAFRLRIHVAGQLEAGARFTSVRPLLRSVSPPRPWSGSPQVDSTFR